MSLKKFSRIEDANLIIDGFREDVKDLLSLFLSRQSHSYPDFLECWQQMKFHLIISGRSIMSELYEMCEECVCVCWQLVSASEPWLHTKCGLFLIHALLQLKPFITPVYVRTTPETAGKLRAICETARQKKDLQVLYVVCSMLESCTFTFSATMREYALEKSYRKYTEGSMVMKDQVENTMEASLTRLLEGGTLASLETTSQEYYRLKCQLTGGSTEPARALNYTARDVAADIRAGLNKATVDVTDSVPAKRLKLKSQKVYNKNVFRITKRNPMALCSIVDGEKPHEETTALPAKEEDSSEGESSMEDQVMEDQVMEDQVMEGNNSQLEQQAPIVYDMTLPDLNS